MLLLRLHRLCSWCMFSTGVTHATASLPRLTRADLTSRILNVCSSCADVRNRGRIPPDMRPAVSYVDTPSTIILTSEITIISIIINRMFLFLLINYI